MNKNFLASLMALTVILISTFTTIELYLMEKRIEELERMTVLFNAENRKQMDVLEGEVNFFLTGEWK